MAIDDSEVQVRMFKPRDAERLIALWQQVLPPSKPHHDHRAALCRKRNDSNDDVYVAEASGNIVGGVMVGYDGVRGWIYRLAVSTEFRQRGVGRMLLEAAETRLIQKGCVKVNLQAVGSNRKVLGFYEKCGYAVEDRIDFGKLLPANVDNISDVPVLQVDDDVSLSALKPRDRDHIIRYLNETDEFQRQTCGITFPYTAFEADQWLAFTANLSVEKDRRINWAIRDSDDQLIGGVEISEIIDERNGSIGYWLARPFWGRGIMTKVAWRVCEFGFRDLGLAKMRGGAFSTNPASAKIFEKNGFTREATLRRHLVKNDSVVDLYLYGLLRDEVDW